MKPFRIRKILTAFLALFAILEILTIYALAETVSPGEKITFIGKNSLDSRGAMQGITTEVLSCPSFVTQENKGFPQNIDKGSVGELIFGVNNSAKKGDRGILTIKITAHMPKDGPPCVPSSWEKSVELVIDDETGNSIKEFKGVVTTYCKSLCWGSGPYAVHNRRIESGKIEFTLPFEFLRFKGKAVISGTINESHKTQHYCEECHGDDYNRTKELPPIVVDVEFFQNLDNSIQLHFKNPPKDYIKFTQLPNFNMVKSKNFVELRVDFFDHNFLEGINENDFERKVIGSIKQTQ